MSRQRTPPPERVAVVGAGIAGLAAAFYLRRAGVDAVVLEASDRAGGKVDAVLVEGLTVDSGPDGFLARDTAAADLCRLLGLGPELVPQADSRAFLWSGGRLRPLPERSVLGAPFDTDAVASTGIVSPEGLRRLRRGLSWQAPRLTSDASVGEVLRPRVGDEVFERLVDPLLGGISAGSADQMSIEASAAPLYEAACRGGPFGSALRRVAAERSTAIAASPSPQASPHDGRATHVPTTEADTANSGESSSTAVAPHFSRPEQHDGCAGAGAVAGRPAPVFQSLRGATTRVIDALVAHLGGCLNLSTPVESLTRRARAVGAPGSWRVDTARGSFDVDSVILATPAWETARLLKPHATAAAETLGDIEYADVALAVFVAGPGQACIPPGGSGFLVPRCEGLLMTACSWWSSKWPFHIRDGRSVLRASVGRTDDRRWLDLEPGELAMSLTGELAETGVIPSPTRGQSAPVGTQTRTQNTPTNTQTQTQNTPTNTQTQTQTAPSNTQTQTAPSNTQTQTAPANTQTQTQSTPANTQTRAQSTPANTQTRAQSAPAGNLSVRVVQWRRSLPQYRPGHLQRVAAVEDCLAVEAPGIVAIGAAFRGLGLPACVRQAQAAVSALTGAEPW